MWQVKQNINTKAKMYQEQLESQEVLRLRAPLVSRSEIKSLPGKEVSEVAGGIKFLEAFLLTAMGVHYSTDAMVSALFQISMLTGIKCSWANTNTV